MMKGPFASYFQTVNLFDAVLVPYSGVVCTAHMPGLWGHPWVQKRSKNIFSKAIPRPFGVLQQVVDGHFEASFTQISPCKFPKSLEMPILGPKVQYTPPPPFALARDTLTATFNCCAYVLHPLSQFPHQLGPNIES